LESEDIATDDAPEREALKQCRELDVDGSQVVGLLATVTWLPWHFFVCWLVDRFKPDAFPYEKIVYHRPSRFSTSDRNWERPKEPWERDWGHKTKMALTVPYFVGAVIMWILLLT
jgi:hypothetical protein